MVVWGSRYFCTPGKKIGESLHQWPACYRAHYLARGDEGQNVARRPCKTGLIKHGSWKWWFPSSESPNFQGAPIFRWTMFVLVRQGHGNSSVIIHIWLGGGNSNIVYFHPYLGKWCNFTQYFSNGLKTTNQLTLVTLAVWLDCLFTLNQWYAYKNHNESMSSKILSKAQLKF